MMSLAVTVNTITEVIKIYIRESNLYSLMLSTCAIDRAAFKVI